MTAVPNDRPRALPPECRETMRECLYDPKPWRMRAEELRAVAEGVENPATRGELLLLAADYDLLAVRSEARQKAREKGSA